MSGIGAKNQKAFDGSMKPDLYNRNGVLASLASPGRAVPMDETDPDCATLEGYLEKKTKGKLIKYARWHSRYFIVEEHFLRFYEVKYSAVVKGEVDLNGLRTCMLGVNSDKVIMLRFDDQKPLDLRATGPGASEIAANWVCRLQPHCNKGGADEGGAGPLSPGAQLPSTLEAPSSTNSSPLAASSPARTKAVQGGAGPNQEQLATGFMWKRAIKSGRNWKRRFCVLTVDGRFTYYHCDVDKVRDSLDPSSTATWTAASPTATATCEGFDPFITREAPSTPSPPPASLPH
jgi:hypothetical protein